MKLSLCFIETGTPCVAHLQLLTPCLRISQLLELQAWATDPIFEHVTQHELVSEQIFIYNHQLTLPGFACER